MMTSSISLRHLPFAVSMMALTCFLPGCRSSVAPQATPEPVLKTSCDQTYYCLKTRRDAITVDARLDEPAWQAAPAWTDFRTPGPAHIPAIFPSEARLLWNDQYVYLAYRCATDAIRSTLTERDGEIFNSETAELYLGPNGPDRPYYEIDFNPQNAIYDTHVLDYHYAQLSLHWQEWSRGFNPAVQSATRVESNAAGRVIGWIVEAAIPMEAFRDSGRIPPQPGNTWLFNLSRIADKGGNQLEDSCLAPIGAADFHRPYEWPRLTFVKRLPKNPAMR